MKNIPTFEEFLNESLNEFGPLAGSGNVDELDKAKRDASKKSERGDTVYVVMDKRGRYKLSKYYEDGNTFASYHNGTEIVDENISNTIGLKQGRLVITGAEKDNKEVIDAIKGVDKTATVEFFEKTGKIVGTATMNKLKDFQKEVKKINSSAKIEFVKKPNLTKL